MLLLVKLQKENAAYIHLICYIVFFFYVNQFHHGQ